MDDGTTPVSIAAGRPAEWLMALAEPTSAALEAAGVVIIAVGAVLASATFLRQGVRDKTWASAYRRYRANLGRGILLGLEFLVGADIIATVTAPLTFDSLALLALVVLIRTFLSFALETEIEGRWPWTRGAQSPSD